MNYFRDIFSLTAVSGSAVVSGFFVVCESTEVFNSSFSRRVSDSRFVFNLGCIKSEWAWEHVHLSFLNKKMKKKMTDEKWVNEKEATLKID